MIDKLIKLDTELFLFLNGIHNTFFDNIMFWVSQTVVWIPLWIFFVFLLFKVHGKKAMWLFVGLILSVGLADFTSVELFKNIFQRLRPCHNDEISAMVHIVKDHCGGRYGFISSHSTNMFAIAGFMFLALQHRYRYSFLPLLFWAALIAYSRVYLGVHYPGDILAGAIWGCAIGSLGWFVSSKLINRKLNKNNLV